MSTDFPFPPGLGQVNYEYDLFTGTQTSVYIADVLVDDILRIGWNVSQRRIPIYGYASSYYSLLASGNIIVQGSFWIGFKEAAYLPLILRRAASFVDEFGGVPSPAQDQQNTSLIESSSVWQEQQRNNRNPLSRENIERIRQNITTSELAERNPASSGDADVERDTQRFIFQLGAANDRDFEDVNEIFEDANWHGVTSSEAGGGRGDVFSNNFRGGEMDDATWLSFRRADQYPPFDLIVTFGDINTQTANHTSIRILDVTINATEFEGIENTGAPIITRYDFLARTIT